MSPSQFFHYGFPLHLSFMEHKLQQQPTYPFHFHFAFLYSEFVFYFFLLYPCTNCQDQFLLWNVLHMHMLELARLGTEIKREYISPLNNGEKKATWYDESEDFCAASNFNISCSSNADHSFFFPNYCFGWTVWFLELVEEHQKSTMSKQHCWEHNRLAQQSQ